ncbi:MAG TPA: hypothetical protein VE963_16475 [Reyranella sp.]|nr:hypothetical protein [Reyranella sp.]
MARLPSEAARTLVAVAAVMEAAQEAWWLIGGSAVAVHGLDIAIADVDVLMSARDLRRVMVDLHLACQEGVATDRVRSDIWVRWTALPLGVDFMSGLHIRSGERWTRVAPTSREAVAVEGAMLYVPSRAELADICRLFGRPKDLERAEGLSRL